MSGIMDFRQFLRNLREAFQLAMIHISEMMRQSNEDTTTNTYGYVTMTAPYGHWIKISGALQVTLHVPECPPTDLHTEIVDFIIEC